MQERRGRLLEVLGQLPTGVTGIPRLKEWDAVALVELPELDASTLTVDDRMAMKKLGMGRKLMANSLPT